MITRCGTFHVLLRQRLRPEVIVAKLRETDEALAREIRKANSCQYKFVKRLKTLPQQFIDFQACDIAALRPRTLH